MIRKIGLPALLLAGFILGSVVSCGHGSDAATTGTVLCSDNPCTVQAQNAGDGDGFDGLVVQGAAGINHALIVTDQNGAPILFTNTNSVSTGDLPYCATSTDLSNRVCIYPGTWNPAAGQYQGAGYVELWPSATGTPVVLSLADIRYLHQLEAARALRKVTR